MARKRLNKKVALVGSAVFVLVAVLVILLILYLTRDPGKFIRDADLAVAAARQAADEQTEQEQYEKAERDYAQAYNLAKTDSFKVKVLFKLVEIYRETDQWRKVVHSWNQIIRLDTTNSKARFARLKHTYLIADSGFRDAWNQIQSQASEFLEVADSEHLLTEYVAQWDPFTGRDRSPEDQRLDSYLYFVRGRANLEIARIGASAGREQLLGQAIADLKRVRQLEPDNVEASWRLAFAVITEGGILASKGDFAQRDKAAERALKILEDTVKVADDNPQAHINLLRMKLMVANVSGDELLDAIRSLEGKYQELTEKFPSSALAHSALAVFCRLRPETLDKAVEAAEKAVELDSGNVSYIRSAADAHYSRFCIYGARKDLDRAVEMAGDALTLPGAQDTPGPRRSVKRRNRILLLAFLAEAYLEQVIEPSLPLAETEKQQLLTKAEESVREIEQILGSGMTPELYKWRGLLELARGNRSGAVSEMYVAYEQLRSMDRKDSLLSYRLGKVFEDTAELGAAREFLQSALISTDWLAGIDEKKPQAILDYAEVLLKLGAYNNAVNAAEFFEQKYQPNARSTRVRTNGYIGIGQFAKAEQELAESDFSEPETIKLKLALAQAKIRRYEGALSRKQMQKSAPVIFREPERPQEGVSEPTGSAESIKAALEGYWSELPGLVKKLLAVEPNSVEESSVISVCNHYLGQGKTDDAKSLISEYIEHFPDSASARFYKQLLLEPQPGKVSAGRRRQIEQQVLSDISDPVVRAIGLGRFHHGNNELDEAAAQFRKVFDVNAPERTAEDAVTERQGHREDYRRLAASYLFEIALAGEDWQAAQKIAETAKKENFDDCQGQFYAARIAMAKGQYEQALGLVDASIKLRPVFSHGYLLRSNIHTQLGNNTSAIEDARKAASLNPLDGTIAKGLATVLYQRNSKLGDNATSDQIIETKQALLQAVRLNPQNLKLRGFYAEYISDESPQEALAILQQLQTAAPSVGTALLLGRMATKLGLAEPSAERKDAMFDIAESSFQQALTMAPQSKTVIGALAEYYRVTGQEQKAQELLAGSADKSLLWVHYFQLGKFTQARQVLQQLYQANPKDVQVVRGLLLTAEKTADQQAVQKYSEELLSIEESIDNHLLQIQAYLRTGLIKEAEHEVESFRERFPDEPRAMLLEAWLVMRQGRLDRALDLVNQNLTADQSNATAWQLRGRISLLKGDYAQAISDFRESKSLSDEPDTRYYLARAYLRANRVDDAITELKNAVDHPQASADEAASGRGPRKLLEQVYLRFDRTRALKRLYQETLQKFPASLYWYNRAGAFAVSAGDYGQAEQLYARALQIAGGSEQSTARSADAEQVSKAMDGYLRALVSGAGTPDAAAGKWVPQKLDKVFEVASRHTDDYLAPVAYVGMAEAKMKLGDKTTATQYCRTALAKAFSGQGQVYATNILARAYSLLGAEGVLNYCRQRLEAEPDSLAANLAMFSLMKRQGQYNKAVDSIDKCINIVGADDPRRTSLIIQKTEVLTLAFNRTSDKDYLDRAIRQYESLIAKMPNNTIVLNNLAYLLAENNEKLPQALEYAGRAYEVVPNNAGVMDTYGYTLYKNGKYAESDRLLQAAVQQYEQSNTSAPPEVYEHLGMAKEKLGAKAEALDAYKQALEQGAAELSEPAKKRIDAAIERLKRQDITQN